MKKYIVIIAAMIVMSAAPAWALDMEYYTYGGYHAIVLAFQKIALIFSDHAYQALFFTIMCVGIFLGVTSILMAAASGGGKAAPWSWAPAFFVGVGIYLALVVPKGSLTIYDPTLNRFETIGNIPNGIVMVAGSLNLIERGIVEIIDTSGNVEGYRRSAGAIGFNAIKAAASGSYGLGNTEIELSVARYVKDCVIYELRRPGSALSVGHLKSKSTSFLTDFSEAQNPALYTVYYSESNPSGETMTCTDAYAAIHNYLANPSNVESVIKQVCSSVGFTASNGLEYSQCQDLTTGYISLIYEGNLSPGMTNFVTQAAIARTIEQVIMSGDTDQAIKVSQSFHMVNSGVSAGLVANEWLPIMRGVFTAVAIGLLPFLCLLIPTGLVGKAAGLIAGFFIWLTCWGITDAVVHGIANDYGIRTLQVLRENNLGYVSFMLYPSEMDKTLALFGFVRTSGIMLATVMTGMIVKFGGTALALMAGNIQGTMQSTSNESSHIANTPDGIAHQIEAGRGAQAAWDNAYKHNFSADSAARAAVKIGQTGGMVGAMDHFGGKDALAKGLGHAGEVNTIQSVARGMQVSNAGAERMGSNQGMEDQARAYDNTAQAMVDTGMAKNLREAYHQMAAVQAYGGTMGGMLGVLQTQGKLDALGDNIKQERDISAQDKGIQIGGYSQRQHMMDYFEMNAQQFGAWEQGGRVLSEDMAEQLRADGWTGAQAGMKAELGFSPDGEISYMTGKTETGQYGASYSGGKLLESYTENGYSMTRITDANGNVLHTQGVKGTNLLSEDRNMTISEHGFKSWSGTDIQRVNRNVTIDDFGYRGTFGSLSRTYDVNETQVSHGTVYSNATMAGMAVTSDGSTSIAKRLLSSDNTEVQDREILTASKAFGESFGKAISRQGMLADSSSGSLGIKVMGAGAGIDVQSTDNRTVNLVTAEHSQKLHAAVTHARTSGMTQGQQEAYVAQAIKSHGQELNTKIHSATAERYGATAPSKGMDDFVKWIP